MTHDFSFSRAQWWGTIAAFLLLVALSFATGFVSGQLWQQRQPTPTPSGSVK